MIKPAGFRVLLESILEEKAAKSSILAIPDSVTRKESLGTEMGKVIDIGELAFKAWGEGTPWVKKGDIVYFVRYSGKEIQKEGKTFRVVNDEDIYAVEQSEAQQ